MSLFVHDAPFDRQHTCYPDTLDVNERALNSQRDQVL